VSAGIARVRSIRFPRGAVLPSMAAIRLFDQFFSERTFGTVFKRYKGSVIILQMKSGPKKN
jgi:hypothetical protein